MSPGRWYALPGGAPLLLLSVGFGPGGRSAQVRGLCVSGRDGGPVLTETVRDASWARRAEVCAPPEVDSRGRPCLDLAREAERLWALRSGE